MSRHCEMKQFDIATMGDPLQWVISKNLKRRQLDESQRSYVASKIEGMKHGGDRKSDQDANWQVDRATAASMLNVSERSIARAAVVRDKAGPELQAAVEQGYIAVSVAAKAATLPAEDQREIAARSCDVSQKDPRKRREPLRGIVLEVRASWNSPREHLGTETQSAQQFTLYLRRSARLRGAGRAGVDLGAGLLRGPCATRLRRLVRTA
jgi:hypothetical protein